MSRLHILPCLDSDEMGEAHRRNLDLARPEAARRGRSALEAARTGFYVTRDGKRVAIADAVRTALSAKVSIPPDAPLPDAPAQAVDETTIQVANETTLAASRRLTGRGLRPLALNFAHAIHPGGGFLHGARAQEEALCRSSALYLTLEGDPMYEHNRRSYRTHCSDGAILSPGVPVFRDDDGTELAEPWLLDFVTCPAPDARAIGLDVAEKLLSERIQRVLSIARAYRYEALVLGAWGCGNFGNDPAATARGFREALTGEFAGAFSSIIFAITDWSRARRTLGPFRDVFDAEAS